MVSLSSPLTLTINIRSTDCFLANGMSEALTIAIYFLICRELNQPAQFPGNEYFWNSIDDNSYAPSLADLTVWATCQEHCRDEVFNHCNGDVFVWKYLWQDAAKYFGVEVSSLRPWETEFKFRDSQLIRLESNSRSRSPISKKQLVKQVLSATKSTWSSGQKINVPSGKLLSRNTEVSPRPSTGEPGGSLTGPPASRGVRFRQSPKRGSMVGTVLRIPLRLGLRHFGLMRMRDFFLLVLLFWRMGIRKIQADSSS